MLMDEPSLCLFWFRRDLRLEDNAGLYQALRKEEAVQPLFIFDTQILDRLNDKKDRRVEFIHQSLQRLQQQLEELGSSLLIYHGDPKVFFSRSRSRPSIPIMTTNPMPVSGTRQSKPVWPPREQPFTVLRTRSSLKRTRW